MGSVLLYVHASNEVFFDLLILSLKRLGRGGHGRRQRPEQETIGWHRQRQTADSEIVMVDRGLMVGRLWIYMALLDRYRCMGMIFRTPPRVGRSAPP